MAHRYRHFGYVARILREFPHDQLSRRRLTSSPSICLLHQQSSKVKKVIGFQDTLRRCSTLPEVNNEVAAHAETLNFIRSTSNELEGPNHKWLNYKDQNGQSIDQDGLFFVLVNAFVEDSASTVCRESAVMFEKVKFLQQRFPKLNILGLQCGSSFKAAAAQAKLIERVMEEYITFPILLSDKNFVMMKNGARCLLFEGSINRLLHHDLDLNLEDIVKVIEEFDAHQKNTSQEEDTVLFQNSNSDSMKQNGINLEPYAASALRNLLLYYPGSVSGDEDGNRLFISDSNHHRIIVTDGEGKILDCIGSFPGFEDGEFESARLFRPAASFYDNVEDCLYFLDSENNAVRRADMEKRTLETVFPVQKTSGLWSWISDKLGLASENDVKTDESYLHSFVLPWHLLKLRENSLVIINRSFEMSWLMDMTTWEIKEVTRGIRNIMENYGHMIEEKILAWKSIYGTSFGDQINSSHSLEGIPCAGLISSVANFNSYVVFCDAASHRVLKYHRESRTILDIQFSDVRVLGLPYWFINPPETVFNSRYSHRPWKDHLHKFCVLPGRCDIRVNVDVPEGTDLVEPLDDNCVWRQARGSAAELSGSEEATSSTEKVGVAQQWFDELDNLAFSKASNESGTRVEEKLTDGWSQDMHQAHFICAVNVSPGMGEVVVSAALYLKLSNTKSCEDATLHAMRILNLEKQSKRNQHQHDNDDACISLLLQTGRSLEDVIFTKPLHLRIMLDCADHPAATTNKETVLTDTALEIHVSLD